MSRPLHRLAAIGGLAAVFALFSAVPAAANPPRGGITAPDADAVLEAPPTVTGSFSHEGGIARVNLSVASADGSPVPRAVSAGCDSGPVSCSGSSASFSWTPDLDWNGTYTVTARATSEDSLLHEASSASASRTFSLAVPPKAPGGFSVDLDQGSRIVTLSWRANSEPDLLHYEVTRTVDGSPSAVFQVSPASGTVTYVDTASAERGGAYAYTVQAVRRGARAGSTITSDAATGGPVAVAEPPPPPTTTSEPPAAGGGGPQAPGTTAPGAPGSSTTGAPAPAAIPRPAPGGGPAAIRSVQTDLSAFGDLRARSSTPPPRQVEVDPGYDETLPYDLPGAPPAPAPTTAGEGGEGESALPVSGSPGRSTSNDRRTLLIPMAAGLILFVGALQLRWLVGGRIEDSLEPL